jgi:hypothetical protein
MSRMLKVLALPLLLMGAAACGKEVVVGGVRDKDVEVYATGDGTQEDSAGASHAPVLSPAPAGGPAATHIGGRVQGTISFDALVEVVTASGEAVRVGNAQSVVVRSDGHDTVLVARAKVLEREYTTVRVTFTRVTANVASGLTIGGISITGQVSVEVPQQGIVVERQVPLGGPEEDVQVLIDLDASDWLFATLDRVVPATAFQQAVKIRTFTR